VPGLVKRVSRADIEAADWSLTPGRYVGVAADEDDPDFDFAATIRGIREELADLNGQAVKLGAQRRCGGIRSSKGILAELNRPQHRLRRPTGW
jgi:hypothetical protein